MKGSLLRLFLVVLLSAAAGASFSGENPNFKNAVGAGQSTVKSVDYRTNGESFAHSHVANAGGKKVNVAKLEVEVPVVKVELFGKEYSVGGAQVCIPVRSGLELNWLEKLAGDGAPNRAQWLSDEGVIVISEKAYSLSQLPSGSGASWKAGYYGWDIDFWKTLRHEAIHALVDMKYKNEFMNENGERLGEVDDWYHFISEMLAYVGGTGISVKEAAKYISNHNNDYKGASVIAKKFLKGESYTPPEVGSNMKGQSDSRKPVSMNDLKNMDLDDENGDWCKCENPGCVNTVKVVDGKHNGYITFECSRCKKINVKFAKEALAFSRIALEEGLPIQWIGANAEEKANTAAQAVK